MVFSTGVCNYMYVWLCVCVYVSSTGLSRSLCPQNLRPVVAFFSG